MNEPFTNGRPNFIQLHHWIACTVLLFGVFCGGCDSAIEFFTFVPTGQSTRKPEKQWNDRSFHEIIESAASTDEKMQRIKQLLEKGGNLDEIRRGCTPAMKATSWGGQYRLALYLLENGASPAIYQNDSNMRLIHFVLSEKPRAMRGNHIEKLSYASLVKWLEDHGESMTEAQEDFDRWGSWEGSPAHLGRLRRAEIAAREKRQQQEALLQQKAEQHEGTARDE